MFGKRTPPNQPPSPPRLRAADIAKLQGGGLVQVIVTHLSPPEFYLFLNDTYVPQMEVDSLSLSVESPTRDNLGGVVRATLARYVTDVTGRRNLQRTELFPCTLEIVGLGRRISVTATQYDSVEGMWISLGLRPDGTSADIQGAQALRVLIGEGFVDAKLTWIDGEVEDLFPTIELGF